MIISREESITYIGGGKITASLLSAATTLFKAIYSMGQNLGSSIYRMFTGQHC